MSAFPLSDIMRQESCFLIPRSTAVDVLNFGRFIFIATTALGVTELSLLLQRFFFFFSSLDTSFREFSIISSLMFTTASGYPSPAFLPAVLDIQAAFLCCFEPNIAVIFFYSLYYCFCCSFEKYAILELPKMASVKTFLSCMGFFLKSDVF